MRPCTKRKKVFILTFKKSVWRCFDLLRKYPGPPPPPPPHSEVEMTACVLPKCPVKGYFSCDKVRPENCKKRGVFDFSPGDFFKKGVFFLFSLISLDSWEIIPNLGGYIEHFSWFRGVSKAGKAREMPTKRGFGNIGSPQIGGASERGNEHMRT